MRHSGLVGVGRVWLMSRPTRLWHPLPPPLRRAPSVGRYYTPYVFSFSGLKNVLIYRGFVSRRGVRARYLDSPLKSGMFMHMVTNGTQKFLTRSADALERSRAFFKTRSTT